MSSASLNRSIGLLAMIVPVWFTGTYLILATLRPEYSHLTKAISELGSVDAPRAWIWNVLGYILPGLVVALLGLGIGNRFAQESGSRVPAWSLVASGSFMALSGVFPGDFENRRSGTMIVHAVGSIGSFVVFVVAAFSLPRVLRRFGEWRPFVWPSLALAAGSIVTGFLRTGSAPGLGQRLGFACFFLWVALLGYALYRDPDTATWRPGRLRQPRKVVGCLLAVGLLAASARAAPPGPSVEKLIETDRTILEQEIAYPVGRAKITAELITIPRGASTSKHLHAVPMFGYVLKGELAVDYGSAGERTYRKGDSLVEAIDWAHRGRNAGKGKVRILVVYAGADGVLNAEPVAAE